MSGPWEDFSPQESSGPWDDFEGSGKPTTTQVALQSGGRGTTPIVPFRIPRPSQSFSQSYPRLAGIAEGGERIAESALSPAGLAIGVGSLAAPMIGLPARAVALAGGAAMVPQTARNITNAIQTDDTKERWASGTEAVGSGAMAYTGLREGLLPPRVPLPMGMTPVDRMISDKFTKAVRPTVVGKANASQIDIYNQRAADAVKTIVENKPNLKILDQYGEPTDKLPQSLHEFTQAVSQTKQDIFQKYDAMQKQAGSSGAQVDLSPVVDELKKVSDQQAVQDFNPDVAGYAKNLAARLENRKMLTPAEAQESIATLNDSLEAYYKNPSYENAKKASVDALTANRLRSALDDAIEKTVGEGYQDLKNKYGALSTIEKDVAHRAIVDARRNSKGLIDMSDILSASDVVGGILKQQPAIAAMGLTKKAVAAYQKWRNDPNVAVRKMFEGVDDRMNP